MLGRTNVDWGNECPRLERDAREFPKLAMKYPKNFYFVRYEDVCKDLQGKVLLLKKSIRKMLSKVKL